MCGIAGYIGPQPPTPERLQAASAALRHRGPDGEGVYTHHIQDQAVALLHRRLAIIDLDPRSDQPFYYQGTTLAFNGEIYNYLEIRRELAALGHQFQTNSDTEVLSHALRHWGRDAFDRLEGMWAFAWYEERSGTLLLSRDRFGEKPLYLWHTDGGLYFASEVKGLAALAGAWPTVNHNHLLRYLVNGYKALYKTKETFYQEIEELPSASCLQVDAKGRISQSCYWTPSLIENERLTYADAVALTREAVIEAVRLRLRADVPLAFCMSGGVDSNTLISVAAKQLNADVHGFTIVNTDARYEEQELVDLSVRDLGIRHTAVELEQRGFLDGLQTLIEAHDAPVSTISYYVHWKLMQTISEQEYQVTISGTAADELFTGYYDHHNLYLHAVASNPELHARSRAAWMAHLAPIVRNPYLKNPDLYLQNPSIRDHIYLNNTEFSTWTCQGWHEPFTETNYGVPLLRNRMLNELFAEAVPVMLHEDDLNAMNYSMENRSPFLDRRLFDCAYTIPTRHLMQDGRAKAVLRDAMRGIVPDVVLNSRRKVGFNAPILDLLDVNDSDLQRLLLSNSSPISKIIKQESLARVFSEKKIPNSMSKFIFNLLNVSIFLNKKPF